MVIMCWLLGDDGQKLTDKYLRDVVLNFVIAGRDTTANVNKYISSVNYDNELFFVCIILSRRLCAGLCIVSPFTRIFNNEYMKKFLQYRNLVMIIVRNFLMKIFNKWNILKHFVWRLVFPLSHHINIMFIYVYVYI